MRRPRDHRDVVMLLALAACLGCDKARPQIKTLRMEDVPPPLLEIAKEKLPGVVFDTAWQKANGTFELRGTSKNGKIREVDIRPDGTVEEVE